MNQICACGSEKPAEDCCEPIISGKKVAETAEELMRSRYVAFTKANINYLMHTHHPSTRPNKERNKIKRWAQSVQWLDLSVTAVKDGLADDEKGTVSFRAFYIENEQYEQIYEESSFEKIDGKWIYMDGIDLDLESQERMFSKD